MLEELAGVENRFDVALFAARGGVEHTALGGEIG